ncbi:MAG: heparin lyase I family protein [Bacteroidota bacterium]
MVSVINFSDDFSSGLNEEWRKELPKETSAVIVKDPLQNGNKVLKFTLNRNDKVIHNGKRSELKLPYITPGSEYTYSFSLLLPKSYVADNDREIVSQWHSKPDSHLGESGPGQPPLSLATYKGNWMLYRAWDSKPVTLKKQPEGKETINLGRYETGTWTNWKFEIRWSHKNNGVIYVWQNDELVWSGEGPNTYNDQRGPNYKVGIYKPGWKSNPQRSQVNTRTLFVDDVTVKPGILGDSSGKNINDTPKRDNDVTVKPDISNDSSGKNVNNTSNRDIAVSNVPLNFFNKKLGTKLSADFSLSSVPKQGIDIEITATDIDKEREAKLFLNGKEIELPDGIIVSNSKFVSDILSVSKNKLVKGENRLTFQYADNLGGTTNGFKIEGIEIKEKDPLLNREQSSPSLSKQRLNFSGAKVGTKRTSVFNLSSIPDDATLQITATDIDAREEASLTINGRNLPLPSSIVKKNGRKRKGSIELDSDMLRIGSNRITFEFESNLNRSTRGFQIDDLSVVI